MVGTREPVTHWTSGNVTLLDDAAHPTLQYLAQGAQMVVEDALVLADNVTAHGANYASAFIAYQNAHLNRTARVVLSSRFFGEWLHADGGARELRDSLGRQRDPENCWEVKWLYGDTVPGLFSRTTGKAID
ncbi:MAG: hypothetical protein EXR86_08030 [Gammaproteobacteria bacterium]|nr:hypothetical protein [Gammaproteobacteria bacterium]